MNATSIRSLNIELCADKIAAIEEILQAIAESPADFPSYDAEFIANRTVRLEELRAEYQTLIARP